MMEETLMPFTPKEIDLMWRIGITLDFAHTDRFTDDEWISIGDIVADRLVLHELDENYEPTPDGMICEDILEKLAHID